MNAIQYLIELGWDAKLPKAVDLEAAGAEYRLLRSRVAALTRANEEQAAEIIELGRKVTELTKEGE